MKAWKCNRHARKRRNRQRSMEKLQRLEVQFKMMPAFDGSRVPWPTSPSTYA